MGNQNSKMATHEHRLDTFCYGVFITFNLVSLFGYARGQYWLNSHYAFRGVKKGKR